MAHERIPLLEEAIVNVASIAGLTGMGRSVRIDGPFQLEIYHFQRFIRRTFSQRRDRM